MKSGKLLKTLFNFAYKFVTPSKKFLLSFQACMTKLGVASVDLGSLQLLFTLMLPIIFLLAKQSAFLLSAFFKTKHLLPGGKKVLRRH